MATYSVSDAKNRLSALLAKVRKGARITITDRGIPVAILVPPGSVDAPAEPADARLAWLVRTGVAARRRAAIPTTILKAPPPAPSRGASAVQALLADRDSDR